MIISLNSSSILLGIKFSILLLMLTTYGPLLKAQDSITQVFKNSVSIDGVPLYYDCFDYRKQIRFNVNYTRQFKSHWFLSSALDIGLFDDYTFIKYYDFFNQNQGFYSVTQRAKISGFHFISSYNYYFCQSKKKMGQGFYGGGAVDFNYYRKTLKSNNSLSLETTFNTINQFRTALGVDVGIKYFIRHHFFAELRSSFFCKLFLKSSNNTVNNVMPLNAQWTSLNKNFWLITNLQFGYAF
ncbi:MAG: hypothetical protein WCQ95_09850 [Bacteroidota bacterium]